MLRRAQPPKGTIENYLLQILDKQKLRAAQMDRRKAGFIDGLQGSAKFLARYRSQPLSDCCFCCLATPDEDFGSPLLEQSTFVPTAKISIKEINRNRPVQGIANLHWRANTGNRSQQQKRTQLSDFKRKEFRNTEYGNNSAWLRPHTNPAPIQNRICFTYDSRVKQMSTAVTSRTVHQSRFPNPEEATKRSSQMMQQHETAVMNMLESEFNDVLDFNHADLGNRSSQSRQSKTAKQSQSAQKKPKQAVKLQSTAALINFSFGDRQKSHLMSKYLQESASRQPQTIKELKESLLQLQSKYLSIESCSSNKRQVQESGQQIEFMRGTFNRKGMMNFIHRVQTVSQEMGEMSEQSVVIDDFHSIVDNLKRKKRQLRDSQKFHRSDRQ